MSVLHYTDYPINSGIARKKILDIIEDDTYKNKYLITRIFLYLSI